MSILHQGSQPQHLPEVLLQYGKCSTGKNGSIFCSPEMKVEMTTKIRKKLAIILLQKLLEIVKVHSLTTSRNQTHFESVERDMQTWIKGFFVHCPCYTKIEQLGQLKLEIKRKYSLTLLTKINFAHFHFLNSKFRICGQSIVYKFILKYTSMLSSNFLFHQIVVITCAAFQWSFENVH